MKNEKIIEKIQKLLALGKSSNEHEAKLAMMKAQKMLAKHKLTMQQVEETKIEKINIEENVSDITFRKNTNWKAELANVIADNFSCYVYYRKTENRNRAIIFFGKDEDTEVCRLVYEYAVDSIYAKVKRLRAEQLQVVWSTKGLLEDYAQGFTDGLEEQFEEQKKANQEWGLVLQKDIRVVEAYNNIKFSASINISSQYNGNAAAYDEGAKDGKEFSITDKIENEGEEVLEIEERNKMC